jgi:hypothetical protein
LNNRATFKLDGEQWDLEELALAFQKGTAAVKKIDDGFYLSLEMEAGRRDEDVIADGKAALNRMNAICLVQDERFRPPRVKGITRRDPATVARPRPAVLGFRGRLGVRPALQSHR